MGHKLFMLHSPCCCHTAVADREVRNGEGRAEEGRLLDRVHPGESSCCSTCPACESIQIVYRMSGAHVKAKENCSKF